MRKGIALLLTLLLPVVVFASEEAQGGHQGWFSPIWGIPAVIWQFINLAIVVGLFYYLLRWRLPNVLRKRSVEIEAALDKARKEKKESLGKLKELEDKMAGLEDEIAKIKAETKEATEREKARLTESARESAEWLRKEADEEFSRREREAERRLKAMAVEEALRMAREQVRGTIAAEDEEKLFGRFSGEIKDRVNG